ncbi:perilipin [Plakobranchus ocellatus]|uniref:Perilipin n=1 Tax=Plakobranchus ocellatus TaxID=259542 RepID=A0AAV3YBN5_9GAST|nr:perilipin [Plakobranchus ocellatus]
MPAEDQFLNKLGELPIVNDGWSAALGYYTKVKDYNSLTKFTLGAAECSLKKAAEISTPVMNRYQSQIDSVNTFACNKLEDIEAKYPLIKQPTEEVKDACVEYVQPVIKRVKPVVSYVNGVVDNTQKKVTQIKTSGTNLVVGVHDLGVNTVSQAVNMTLETPPGRLVTSTVGYALVQADNLLDKYIPEEEQDCDEDDDENIGDEDNGAENQVEQMEEMPPSPARLTLHFQRLSVKLRRRLHQRARQDFHNAKKRTLDAISQLQQTLDIRDYAKTNLMGAYQKAQDIWGEINETGDQNSEADLDTSNCTYAQALEKRIVAMGKILTRQVRSGVDLLEKATAEAGLFVKDPISKSREYKDLIYEFSSKNLSIEKARDTIIFFQKKLQSMIDNMESPDWLGMDIDMEGIDLGEDDAEDTDDTNSMEAWPGNHI